jgi:multidrug efflux system membrane fusion protein
VVPDNAVQRGPDGLYVFVVGDDDKVGVQAVAVSQSGQGKSVVEHGLTPGQRIVVAGQYRLQAGSLVQPSEVSASNAPADTAADIRAKAP